MLAACAGSHCSNCNQASKTCVMTMRRINEIVERLARDKSSHSPDSNHDEHIVVDDEPDSKIVKVDSEEAACSSDAPSLIKQSSVDVNIPEIKTTYASPTPEATPPTLRAEFAVNSGHTKASRKRAHDGYCDRRLVSGFMRFLTHDDCAQHLPVSKLPCGHRLKRAHYHCMHGACTRAYLLASEAHIHYNTHCKHEQLARDGYARYKAHERCPLWPKCAFANAQRQLTHFHCIRPKCTYVFKAKADMDKHRVMHEREDNNTDSCFRHILAQNSTCPFAHCTVMRSSHVHCLRDGCSQDALFNDEQVNIHKTRLHAQNMQLNLSTNTLRASTTQQNGPRVISPTQHRLMVNPALLRAYNMTNGDAEVVEASSQNDWQQYMRRYTANDACLSGCQLMYKDHYHCIGGEHCRMVFRSKEGIREHAQQHQLLSKCAAHYTFVPANVTPCPVQPQCNVSLLHYHCKECSEVLTLNHGIFARVKHRRTHSPIQRRLLRIVPGPQSVAARVSVPDLSLSSSSLSTLNTSIGSMLSTSSLSSNQSERSATLHALMLNLLKAQQHNNQSQASMHCHAICSQRYCTRAANTTHHHCTVARCYFVCDTLQQLVAHQCDLHALIDIPHGFDCFDKSVPCQRALCQYGLLMRHFHCQRCDAATLKFNKIAEHKCVDNVVTSIEGVEQPLDLRVSVGKSEKIQDTPLDMSCTEPQCNLRRLHVHYHCEHCSQGFAHKSRLIAHMHHQHAET